MRNFETYKALLAEQGVKSSHEFMNRPTINDFIYDGAVLTIPKNTTVFTQEIQNKMVEFVLFPDEDEELVRLYVNWFNPLCSRGTVINDLEQVGDYGKFFKINEGRQFKVKIIEDKENLTPFGRPKKTYKFTWVKL